MIDLMKYRFDEIIEDCTKYGLKIPTNDYLEKGKFPIIDQGQDFIAGYSNSDNGIYSDVPAIIFGDHTRIFKYVDFPFFLGADGVKILKARKEISYKYLFYYFLQAKFPNTGYARHYKWLKELEIPVPTIEKQNSIVNNLDKVTKIIKAHKILLEKYDTLIKSRFIDLFGDPVTNEKGWKTESLQQVAPAKPAKNNLNDKVWLLNLDMVESQTGEVIDYLYVNISDTGNSTYQFDEGNVLYSKLRPYLNKVVIPEQSGICTSELVPLRPTEKLNRYFLANLLRTDFFVNFINEKVAGAKMPRVSMDTFRAFACILPPIELQNQFASFVQQIDKSKFEIEKIVKMVYN